MTLTAKAQRTLRISKITTFMNNALCFCAEELLHGGMVGKGRNGATPGGCQRADGVCEAYPGGQSFGVGIKGTEVARHFDEAA